MRWMAVAAAVLLASACSDDSTGPDPIQIEGNYTLETINGRALPMQLYNFFGGAFIINQTGGRLAMSAGRTFREEDYLEIRSNSETGTPVIERDTTIFTGTWASEDSVVTWTVMRRVSEGRDEAYSEVMFGFVSRNRLTLNFESGDSLFTFVYRRD